MQLGSIFQTCEARSILELLLYFHFQQIIAHCLPQPGKGLGEGSKRKQRLKSVSLQYMCMFEAGGVCWGGAGKECGKYLDERLSPRGSPSGQEEGSPFPVNWNPWRGLNCPHPLHSQHCFCQLSDSKETLIFQGGT